MDECGTANVVQCGSKSQCGGAGGSERTEVEGEAEAASEAKMVHKSKTRSKRKSLRQKYSQEKAKKAHKLQMIKAIKANPNLALKSKKDPGIPNLFPFKNALLDAAERRKGRAEEEAAAQKERRRREVLKKRRQQAARLLQAGALGAAEAEAEAEARAAPAAAAAASGDGLKGNSSDHQRRGWYMKELRRTMDEADVVLEVLDARDPMGCRCPAVERLITGRLSAQAGRPKRVILVLNKIDLVPPEVAARWVDYLRADFPCVAFKASTQKQAHNLGQSRGASLAATSAAGHGSAGAGAGKLSQLLKEFAVRGGVRSHITVGVIGYPNVGKSSVINTLVRSRAAGVGAAPGFTKEVSSIKLDRNITLLDSPGVLFSSSEAQDPGLALRNCLKVEDLDDPVGAVRVMLQKCPPAELMVMYKVPAFGDADEFLFHVAKLRGKLRKGGVPDMEAAARLVLQDWNQGSIQYYTEPPASRRPKREEVDAAGAVGKAEVVESWSEEFDIDKIIAEHNAATFAAADRSRDARHGGGKGAFMRVDPSEPPRFSWEAEVDGAGAGDGMDGVESDGADGAGEAADAQQQQQPATYRIMNKARKRQDAEVEEEAAPRMTAEDEHNHQANRNRKLEQKRLRKQRAKNERRAKKAGAGGGMEAEAAAAVEDAPYDFDADWED